MALLSQMFRTVAVTGRTDTLDASWFAGRQGGRWAEQTVRAAFPSVPDAQRTPPAGSDSARADPAETLRELTELRQRGVVTDAEFEALRTRLRI